MVCERQARVWGIVCDFRGTGGCVGPGVWSVRVAVWCERD